ncbi:MAG: hypothetical protein KF798_01995 [Candidatus Paracaedibacteraceae bacterium]|nr:hypothetical protein [Candidatus Paracaedibacteraceae bacterium]
MHFKSYIKLTKETSSNKVSDAIEKTVSDISPKYIQPFDFNSHKSGLLLGNVQSGKTGHMLGILADAADHDFEVFIVLTTDSTYLQKQTFHRALTLLDTFCVCDEQDDIRFLANEMRKPVVLILKKNVRVLETWKNNLISSKFLNGRPVFIIDDESDAASLNTKVNKDSEASSISQKITDIRGLSNSSFYLQVTATPQSLFLQEQFSGYKPEFVYYFKPGTGYLGGNFFYRTTEPYTENQIPFAIKFTGEEELTDLREDDSSVPDGMQSAIASFLIASADIHINKSRSSCNFLVHPSVSISDHETIAERIGEILNDLLYSIRNNETFTEVLKDAWIDLQNSKPDITDFEECHKFISDMLENEKITLSVMNSKAKFDIDFEKGINIVIGGNSLGRGVTFPNLQTTYYCRKSKKPQADTYWQHCRAFGYDRDSNLVRVFIPPSLFKLFAELNNANNAMIEYLEKNGPEGLRLIYPKNVNPTRQTVVNKKKVEIIVGGVNHFPSFPTEKNTLQIDDLLKELSDKDDYHTVDLGTIKKIVKLCESEFKNDWPNEAYIKCIESIQDKDQKDAILILRRGRDIGKGTGTLLSPNDRRLGDEFPNKTVLTIYKITGEKWGKEPFWIPNIKLPKDKFFYNMGE